MSRPLDLVISWGLIVAIVFTGLAHGATEPWSVVVLQLLLIAIVELWALRLIVQRRFRIVIPRAAFPLAWLIILGIVQSIAWTRADGRRASLSFDVDMTRGTVFMLVVLLAAFLIAANFWTSKARLRTFSWFITLYGFALSIFALIQGFTWNQRFYWIRPVTDLIAPYGPFPSHNNYAGYVELMIPVSIAMALGRVASVPARLFCAFAAVIMSLSVVFSLSRGGMVSLAGGLLFLGIVSLQMARRRRRVWEAEELDEFDEDDAVSAVPRWRRVLVPQTAIVVGIAGAVLIGLLWLGPDTVASRLTQGTLSGSDPQGQNFYASRGWIWGDTWSLIKANPVVGVGLGAYRTAFPVYSRNDGSLHVSQTHNDYLQILADGGVVGGLLGLWFLFEVFRAFGRGLRSRERWHAVVTLGAGAAIFSLLVHSVFDFNLQIPSTALLFLVLAALIGGVDEVQRRESRSLSVRKRQELAEVAA